MKTYLIEFRNGKNRKELLIDADTFPDAVEIAIDTLLQETDQWGKYRICKVEEKQIDEKPERALFNQ